MVDTTVPPKYRPDKDTKPAIRRIKWELPVAMQWFTENTVCGKCNEREATMKVQSLAVVKEIFGSGLRETKTVGCVCGNCISDIEDEAEVREFMHINYERL